MICFLRLPAVLARVGMSRSALYRRIEAGDFPAPRKNGCRISYWIDSEITDWQRAQMAR
jgi:prophage regulatory protein